MIIEKSKISVDLYNRTIATNVLFFREEKGFSQDDLAELSGLKKKQIWKIENNQFTKYVDEYYISVIARALKINEHDLTSTNEKVLSEIDYLNLAAYQLPIEDETFSRALSLIETISSLGPKERAMGYLLLGIIHYLKGNFGTATEWYDKAYEFAQKANNNELLQRVRRNLSLGLMMVGMYGKAEEIIRDILRNETQVDRKARDMHKLATLFYSRGVYNKAEELYCSTLDIFKDSDIITDVKAKTLQAMGEIERHKKNYDASLTYCESALQVAAQCDDPIASIYAYKTIGLTYKELKRQSNARSYLDKGIDLAVKTNRPFEQLLLSFERELLLDNYDEMLSIALKFEGHEAPLHEVSQVYEVMTEKAFDLKRYEDARLFHRKSNDALKGK